GGMPSQQLARRAVKHRGFAHWTCGGKRDNLPAKNRAIRRAENGARQPGGSMHHRHVLAAALSAAGVALCAPATVVAQGYPEKPVTLVVPWPAGGSTDIAMRTIAEAASKHLGQPVVVDNKPGATGTLGPA